jgi:hypothetical protein
MMISAEGRTNATMRAANDDDENNQPQCEGGNITHNDDDMGYNEGASCSIAAQNESARDEDMPVDEGTTCQSLPADR